ncbi:DUF3558 family protein [Rhodococcus sp. NPDC058521]|uniref:DUF3558 family protein n=1 Tax=Rhodococcus sp. NPDC058521 TaxID=3346536 RepID=UPI003668500E
MRTNRGTAIAGAMLAMVGMAATGCSGGEDSDTPETRAVAQPWDPCTLSDGALRNATIDPATEGPGPVEAPGEENCGWKTTDDISVIMTASTILPVDDIRNGPGNTDFQDVTVAGRSAFTFRDDGYAPDSVCWLVVPFQNEGLVLTQVARSVFTKDTTPMCEWAVRVGDALAGEIPR